MSRILYCRCAYAQVVPETVKDEALRGLSDSGCAFTSVTDLCEMSARRDPALTELLADGPLKIVACYPRAVKWLLHRAGAVLPEGAAEPEVYNMREEAAETILDQLLPD